MLDAIIIDTKNDTHWYSYLLNGIESRLLVNPDRDTALDFIKGGGNDLLLFGHGTELGLLDRKFDRKFGSYVIGRSDADILQKRRIIGIWCFASNFADYCNLHGFFTSDFISNEREAAEKRFNTEQETIDRQSRLFAQKVNCLLRNNIDMSTWVETLQSDTPTYGFEKYNYEALSYYE